MNGKLSEFIKRNYGKVIFEPEHCVCTNIRGVKYVQMSARMHDIRNIQKI